MDIRLILSESQRQYGLKSSGVFLTDDHRAEFAWSAKLVNFATYTLNYYRKHGTSIHIFNEETKAKLLAHAALHTHEIGGVWVISQFKDRPLGDTNLIDDWYEIYTSKPQFRA